MALQISISAARRTGLGKQAAGRLRRGGQVPAVLYGGKKETVALTVDPKALAAILRSETGHNTVFEVVTDGEGGEKTAVMIVDWQRDPVRGSLLHVDLKRIALDQRVRVKAPVRSQGEATGVKVQGGVLELVTREIELECLPGEIPDHILVDVSALDIGQNLRVGDLRLPAGVRVVTAADRVVAHVVAVKEEVAPVPAEGAAEAAPAEPEVAKKGKAETPAEEAAPAAAGKEAKEGKEAREGKKKA